MLSKFEVIGLILIAFFILVAVIVMAVRYNDSASLLRTSTSLSVLDEPVQTSPYGKEPIVLEGKDYKYLLTPKASYRISAQIKGKKKYNWDWNAAISPYDLLLVWGDLANPTIDDGIKYSQSGRWYQSSFSKSKCPFKYNYINDHAANNHIIPANAEVRKSLDLLQVDQNVHIEGYLVYLDGLHKGKNVKWRSSLRRTDSGNGACEVFYVEKISLIEKIIDTKELVDVDVKDNAIDPNDLSVVDSGELTAEGYYEKGKIFFKNQDYKKAIIYYQKALKLMPDNVNIKANLEIAKNKIKGL